MIEWGSDQAIISEINENDPIPYISSILQDTCPTNANHTITIYGQNFQPNTTVSIVGTSNIITDVISPSELSVSFTAGSIAGDFDVVVINGTKTSALWGEIRKIYIIANTGGTLPLLDTWIDCRFGGSSDGMIGSIIKDANSTWTRGAFGYSLTNLATLASNFSYYFGLNSYSFSSDLPISLELILYISNVNSTIRWGLLPLDSLSSSFSGLALNLNAATQVFWSHNLGGYSKYEGPPWPLNSYVKIKINKEYAGVFNSNTSFATLSTLKEFFIDRQIANEAIGYFKLTNNYRLTPGVRFMPAGINVSNYAHLTAFKLSWA